MLFWWLNEWIFTNQQAHDKEPINVGLWLSCRAWFFDICFLSLCIANPAVESQEILINEASIKKKITSFLDLWKDLAFHINVGQVVYFFFFPSFLLVRRLCVFQKLVNFLRVWAGNKLWWPSWLPACFLDLLPEPCQCPLGDCKVIRNKDIISIQNRQG